MSQRRSLGKDTGSSGNISLFCGQMTWHLGIQLIFTSFPVCNQQPSPPHSLPQMITFQDDHLLFFGPHLLSWSEVHYEFQG